MDELVKWSIFRDLKKSFLKTVKLFHVYTGGDSALIVDNNDRVFQLRRQCRFIKAAGLVVKELSGQQIVEFANGRSHQLALSKAGVVYVWGSNSQGQLAIVSGNIRVPVVCEKLQEYKIVKISCGDYHSLALTADGKLLSWGYNNEGQCGTGAIGGSVDPAVIGEKVVDFCAVSNYSCFVTKEGQLYVFGKYAPKQRSSSPKLLDMCCNRVIQVVLGQNYTLALSEDGTIVSWGDSDKGQLGNGIHSTSTQHNPAPVTKIFRDIHEVKFVDIAAHKGSCTSAALSTTGDVYVWGQFTESAVPMKTSLETLDSVFTDIGTYRNVKIDEKCTSLESDVLKAFDNPDHSDCRFVIGEQLIHANKAILELRSEYLKSMLNGEWSESSGTIRIHNYSYTAYYAFIKYLYSDILDISDDYLLELLQLAHEVMNSSLMKKCALRIRRRLTVDNVCDVFQMARTLNVSDLMTHCRKFASGKLTSVIMSDAYARLSPQDAYCFTWFVSRNELPPSEDAELKTEQANETVEQKDGVEETLPSSEMVDHHQD